MFKSVLLFILAALFLFFEMALQVSPGIMTENLMSSLHIDIFWLGVTSGAYFITYTLMQIPAGLIYDRFSARNVIMLPLLICIIGGFLFGLAPNFYLAACARIFMGFGSAFAFIGVLVVASHVFSKRYFTLIAGITQMLAALGAMCGALPLIPLIDHFGWRATMMIISSFGLILLIIMFFYLKLPNKHLTTKPVTSSWLAFKSVARQSQTWMIAIYACLLWMPMAVVASLYGIPFVEQYFNVPFSVAATIVTFMWIGIAIGSPLFGFLADKTEHIKRVLVLCAVIGTVAFGFITLTPINSVTILVILFFAAGAACAGQALSFSLVSRNNKLEHRATAIGFNNMAVVISGFIFQPFVGYVIRESQSQLTTNYLYNGSSYHNGMIVVLFGYLIASIAVIFLIKVPHSNSSNNDIAMLKS
ncbi:MULTISPECIES: MFS transporter [Cysteiniphilum]|uniref:MFS transporter n=1 Tax=Cysteiniphilum litorale TaxID=2056700 RepID=A0A8J2Z2G8_9GAMM|nr:MULTISPECIES: MFS transporter [Cysteiniphilum]GGF88294.1 MFS transporter [Cysteiniphilum litorale]